jgi:threonine dehydratase
MAGQGTLGLEIADQVSNVDAVIVPVGGGGLIAGVALAIKTLYPKTTIIVSNTVSDTSTRFLKLSNLT